MKIINKFKYFLPLTSVMLPFVAFASTNATLKDIISLIAGYLNIILALMMGLAVVFFVFYVIQYFARPNDKRGEGATYVMWSLIGFFIIFSFWGVVNIFIQSFSLGSNTPGTWSDFTHIFPN